MEWWKDGSKKVADVVVSSILMTASFSEHSDEGEPARFDLKEDVDSKEDMNIREDMGGDELSDNGDGGE